MSEWQPIETAPKDGTPFLIYSEGRIGIAYMDPRSYGDLDFFVSGAAAVGADPFNSGRPCLSMSDHYLSAATHWTPLPPTPAGEGGA